MVTASAWAVSLVTAVLSGHGSNTAFVGTVATIVVVSLTPWVWLPISLVPSRLTTVVGRSLCVPTCREIVHLDLDRIVAVDARTVPGHPNAIPFLSLRDDQGRRVVLVWDSLSENVERTVRDVILNGTHVRLTPRASARLRVGRMPSFAERLRLSLETGGVFLAACLLLAVEVVRVYLGFWIWQAW